METKKHIHNRYRTSIFHCMTAIDRPGRGFYPEPGLVILSGTAWDRD